MGLLNDIYNSNPLNGLADAFADGLVLIISPFAYCMALLYFKITTVRFDGLALDIQREIIHQKSKECKKVPISTSANEMLYPTGITVTSLEEIRNSLSKSKIRYDKNGNIQVFKNTNK